LLFLLLFTVAFGQAPANYYTTATGMDTLKRNFTHIKGHTVQDYAGLYITYETSDIDNFF
jgi:hypothetical protein